MATAISSDDIPFDPARNYRGVYPAKAPFLQRQPLRFFYGLVVIAANMVQLPLWIVAFLIPRFRPNPNWSLQTSIVNMIVSRHLYHSGVCGSVTPLSLGSRLEGKRWEVIHPSRKNVYIDKCIDPRGVVKPVPLGGCWAPAKPVRGSADKQTILHFHGGAFVIGDARDLYSGYARRTLQKHVAPQVVTAGYRLASNADGYFPAQLQDAVSWWFHLVDELGIAPGNIVLSGDSAGANLAYTLLRYMELHRDIFPVLPAAMLLWSPWIDMVTGFHQDEIPLQAAYKTDYIVPGFPGWGVNAMCVNYPATDPWVSALRGVYVTDVPTFIQTGSSEILFPDITAFHKKISEAESNGKRNTVEIHVSPNANHDIVLIGNLMGFNKEVVAAAVHAKKFVTAAFEKQKKA